ncbi:hypothetical protein AMS68_007355 [Peltaster fructicola]|uniref:PAC domain-containing protein n=1 Tax=Peltaster fructicola TaxID=286661 RepID=A0A6H0Y4S0_9PEZI|nr:hypothetical protein AMS68_007355 [Peltaster fructicola]
MAEVSVRADQPTKTRGRRFMLLTRNKRNESPPPPVPHYSPVSPIEDDGPSIQRSAENIWPGQRSPALTPAREPGPTTSARTTESPEPRSIFDDYDQQRVATEATTTFGTEEPSYDLKPPPPGVSQSNIELLSGRLFSIDHLNIILRDSVTAARFTRFLKTYRPDHSQALKQYAESRKAVLAIEYANAVAGHLYADSDQGPSAAASLDRGFQAQMTQHVSSLVEEALPAYITHRLTHIVTDTLVKEITQNGAPILRELIPNLAEVYCVTDPALPDNPIVYASQEFYNVSQYGREYVIGRNCRFLQGPKTSHATIQRLIDALRSGQEVCETVLNYRRDGTPFMNLLLIAPLYDNKGQVRYFLGCQVDVSSLIEGGRGLESFEQLLAQDRHEGRFAGALQKDPRYALTQFGQMLSTDEISLMKTTTANVNDSSSRLGDTKTREPRRIIGMDEVEADRPLWPHHSFGPSGRLPGVYQNYLLVRPYPSLRITFTSPALRIPGLVQAKLLERIGGPQHVRDALLDAFAHGTGVTAKIQWLTGSVGAIGQSTQQLESRPRWIHCTPLLGSDEQVGVWMVVMVEQEEISGSLRRPMPGNNTDGHLQLGPVHSSVRSNGTASTRATRGNLYADYLSDGRRRDDSVHPGGSLSDSQIHIFEQ